MRQQDAPQRLEALRTPEGTGLPPNIVEEFRRDMVRLALVREQIAAMKRRGSTGFSARQTVART